jgi:fluoroacetyl-CoA thioesterase
MERIVWCGPGSAKHHAAKSGVLHRARDTVKEPMDARELITIGMSAERTITVRPDLTVKHFVPKMPAVFATPMMIMEMEMASADAIAPHLAAGWVTVGTEVDIRHLGASAVGAKVRTTARVIAVERRVIRFEVEAYDGERKIGDGRHARGLVNVASFEKRLGAL